ncbi:hypothetical protein ABIA16_003550 [Sinorhizobium fredii]
MTTEITAYEKALDANLLYGASQLPGPTPLGILARKTDELRNGSRAYFASALSEMTTSAEPEPPIEAPGMWEEWQNSLFEMHYFLERTKAEWAAETRRQVANGVRIVSEYGGGGFVGVSREMYEKLKSNPKIQEAHGFVDPTAFRGGLTVWIAEDDGSMTEVKG